VVFFVKEKEIDGEKNRLVLGDVRFTNPRFRAIVQSLELLIDVCIPSCDDQNELKQAVAYYQEALQILRAKSEFTTEELATKKKAFDMELADGGGLLHSRGDFQVSVSHQCFLRVCFRQYVRDGCTNYIHNLSVGHILFVKILSAVS
jgi:hypothetical protein